MKIALVAASLPEPNKKPCGVDVAVHRLANTLANLAGNEVTMFCLNAPPADARYQFQPLFPQFPWLKTSKLGRLLVFPALLNFVDFRSFDVVHFHGDDWFYLNRPIPSVRTLHGSALNEARSATSLKRKIAQSLVYPLEHLSTRLATIPLAIGTDTASIYQIETLVDNGVHLDRFCSGAKTADPSILFVGTWAGRKRGKFLFETFVQQILPQVPQATLYMVCDSCPAHPRVVDVRVPSDAQLAELFRQSWVFAYPSSYEGFGIPYVEALASGTPIVCSPNVGSTYVLAAGKYGVITEDQAFGPAVVELLTNADRRAQLAENGRDRAQQFSWTTVAQHHQAIYHQAIARFGRELRQRQSA